MTNRPLDQANLIAFIATASPAEARRFYGDTLGCTLLDDSPFALEFDANGTILRVAKVESLTPPPYTVLGWRVNDIDQAITALTAKGVSFERFDGMPQDDAGVWQSPAGAKVAWFKDPDGNTLSLTEF